MYYIGNITLISTGGVISLRAPTIEALMDATKDYEGDIAAMDAVCYHDGKEDTDERS